MTATNRSSARGALALLLALLAGTAGAGCGFFDTRNPVDTGQQPTVPREPPTEPQAVLFNYWNAVRYGLVGLGQFNETLDEGFRLTFDPSDSLELGFGSIDADQKGEAFRLVATGVDSFLFIFEEKDPDELGANTAFYNRIVYEGAVLDVQPDTVIALRSFSGSADLRLQTDNVGNWVLRSWIDFRDASGNDAWGRVLGDQVAAGKPEGRARLR